MTLKELRKAKGITQKQAADFVGVPLRTYHIYENDLKKYDTIKYKYILEKLYVYGYTDETNGILTLNQIKEICTSVLSKYSVNYCYLFGSYAKGKATPISDIDLFINTEEKGLNFFGLVEDLRTNIKKKVDLLDQNQIKENFALMNEILKDGIKIYG